MNIVNGARRTLIRSGKALPFAICCFLAVSYSEGLVSLMIGDYITYNGYLIPNKRISYFISKFFEYDWLTICMLAVLVVSLETCTTNKMCVAYLAMHQLAKDYIEPLEITETAACVLCIANIIISVLFVYKGLIKGMHKD